MNLAKKLWMTTGDSSGGGPAPSGRYVDDVFSTYVYKGNGVNRSFVTGQNLLADGGMVWTKGRSGTYGATDHYLFHTERGHDIFMRTNTANGQGTFTAGTSVSSFNNDGFSLGTSPYVNDSATEYVSWVFKNAPKFYGHQVATKSAGSNVSVNFPELGELGVVRVKSISGAGSWYVWHRSLPSGQLLIGETTATSAALGHVTVSGTTVTLVNSVIANGQYLVEAFAHDTSSDGVVQCGGYTGTGTVDGPLNDLGWEPQLVLIKNIGGVARDWYIYDSVRGITADLQSTPAYALSTNLAQSEFLSSQKNASISISSTGFKSGANQWVNEVGSIYMYVAIRRPNKPPTSATQVYFNRAFPSGTVSTPSMEYADVAISTRRDSPFSRMIATKICGIPKEGVFGVALKTDLSDSEWGYYGSLVVSAGGENVFCAGNDNRLSATINGEAGGVANFFRRAPGFLDVVCDTGTGVAHNIYHGLSKTPELLIRKCRNSQSAWEVWHKSLYSTDKLVLNSNSGKMVDDPTIWDSVVPTTTHFTVGTSAGVNVIGGKYVTYLFATLPGISKVGSYSGNGGTQTIPCGFTTGSRFILIKRIDNIGDWFVWDTARGITPTTDPHLSLNTTSAEVTTDDSIDQDASGFVVNQNAATNINYIGGNYLFLAIA